MLAGNFARVLAFDADDQFIPALADLRARRLHHQHLAVIAIGPGRLQRGGSLPGGFSGKIQASKYLVAHGIFAIGRDKPNSSCPVRLGLPCAVSTTKAIRWAGKSDKRNNPDNAHHFSAVAGSGRMLPMLCSRQSPAWFWLNKSSVNSNRHAPLVRRVVNDRSRNFHAVFLQQQRVSADLN